VNETIVRVGSGETALFGFGSLCSAASMERTLGRRYDSPCVRCDLENWRRGWDVAMPNSSFHARIDSGSMRPENILYLNIRRQKGSSVAGMLFVVSNSDLEGFDRREWIYDRADVSAELSGVRVEGGEAIAYVAKPEYVMRTPTSPNVAAVRASYLRILDEAFRDLGPEFRTAYERTTDPIPEGLVIDDFQDHSAPDPFGYSDRTSNSASS
jgi:hypothetical protein